MSGTSIIAQIFVPLRQVASLPALENDFCKKKRVHRSYKADLHGMLVFWSVKISINGVF